MTRQAFSSNAHHGLSTTTHRNGGRLWDRVRRRNGLSVLVWCVDHASGPMTSLTQHFTELEEVLHDHNYGNVTLLMLDSALKRYLNLATVYHGSFLSDR